MHILKKISVFLLIMFASVIVNGQLANNWLNDAGIEIFQESNNVHEGDFSAGVVVLSSEQANCDLINQNEIPVSAGESFLLSFWGIASQHVYIRVFFYWEGTNNNFTSEFLGPAIETWENFTYESTVPDGATALSVGVRFYDTPGFEPGEIQYIDDLTFQSPIGNPLEVANGNFENWATIKPEPDEYPAGFSGTQKGLSACLSWTGSGGDQLPDNYLILGALDQVNIIPEDGIYYPDNPDFSAGNVAVNLTFGTEYHAFTHLEALSNYHFKIFPYTNTGNNINYKTDGTPPETFIEIPDVAVITEQDFDTSWNNWEIINIIGDQIWNRENNFGLQETPCARISGNQGGITYENEDWIISPSLDFTLFENESVSFYTSAGYFTQDEQFMVKIATDYDGSGDPASASWTNLNPILPNNSNIWEWVFSGENSLSDFDSENVHVAFVYTCGADSAETWQLDNLIITGEKLPLPEPSNYPTAFAVHANSTSIDVSWVDAEGDIAPEAYLIIGTDQQNIVPPVDGVPKQDDIDFSDGSIALNVPSGDQLAPFPDLISGKFYHFSIFPYTNSDSLINYKSDETSPSAYTFISDTIDRLFTSFNNNWGGWTPVSILGDQVWNRNNSSGIDNTPCAKFEIAGDVDIVNEDWLISPPIELPESANVNAGFYSAKQNPEQELSIEISMDYDGVSNPNSFTWIDLSDMVNWSEGQFNWAFSGDIPLAEFAGNTLHIAFRYDSNAADNIVWGIDNVRVWEMPTLNGPTNYPAEFNLTGNQKQVTATWEDASGEIPPWGYLLQISDDDVFTIPADGVYMEEDLDFSDGNGIVHVLPETEQYIFYDLVDSTTYFVTIIPYAYPVELIRYKTIPDPPKDTATTDSPSRVFTINKPFKFNISPNPGSGLFRFKADKTIQNIKIYSMNGILVFDKIIGETKGRLDLNNFDKGLYLVVIEASDKTKSNQHIIIQ